MIILEANIAIHPVDDALPLERGEGETFVRRGGRGRRGGVRGRGGGDEARSTRIDEFERRGGGRGVEERRYFIKSRLERAVVESFEMCRVGEGIGGNENHDRR